MIGQRPVKLTAKQEREAYRIVTERDQGMCQRCGYRNPEAMQRDHRQGRNAYNTVPSNLQLLGGPGACGCHLWVTEHPEQAVLDGYTVPRWVARPELWPAYRIGVGWVIYFDSPDADGNWWQPISQTTADLIMNGNTQ